MKTEALTVRSGSSADIDVCAQICFAAFTEIAVRHGFPPDFPDLEVTRNFMAFMLSDPNYEAFVAELDGQPVGINVLFKAGEVGGIGPLAIVPEAQNAGIGRQLMQLVIERGEALGLAGLRLMQVAYHARSLALYTSLGFTVREPLALIVGLPLNIAEDGNAVRPMTAADIDDCAALCCRIQGFERRVELHAGIAMQSALVVERDGQLVGYASGFGFLGHAVALDNEAMRALLGAATTIIGPGILLPARNGELLRWCLARKLRIVQVNTLMSLGTYQEPNHPFLVSSYF